MKFADLAREYTSTAGLAPFIPSGPVTGFSPLADQLDPGDQFYYSVVGLDVPAETETGVGTFELDGSISRAPTGSATNFSPGLKTIALVVGAAWFSRVNDDVPAPGGTAAKYWRGDRSWQTLNAAAVGLGNVDNTSDANKPVSVAQAASIAANIATAPLFLPTRAALAAIDTARPVQLFEAGREGLFQQRLYADFATLTDADTQQGIFIRSALDPTKVWVRTGWEHLDIRWFGGKADGALDDYNGAYLGARGATDNSIALNAALALFALNDSFLGADKFYAAAPRIHFPASDGVYDFLSAIEIRRSVHITGDSIGHAGGVGASNLRWGPGVHGFILHSYNSDLAGPVSPTLYGAGGSIIEGLSFFQHGTGNNFLGTDFHGIWIKCPVRVTNCGFYGWSGNGGHVRASVGGGGTLEGNANLTRFDNCMFYGNENGLLFDGADVNAGSIIGCDFSNNRAYGYNGSDFLGNTIIGCHAMNNGTGSAYGNTGRTAIVSHGGNRYGLKVGQAVWAAANAPTGAATDNQGWKYIGAGGPDGATIPVWAAAMALVEGGAYRSDDGNTRNMFINCYAEGGQGLSYAAQPAVFLGGLRNNGMEGDALDWNYDLNGLGINSVFRATSLFSNNVLQWGGVATVLGDIDFAGANGNDRGKLYHSVDEGLIIQGGGNNQQVTLMSGPGAYALSVGGGVNEANVKVWQNMTVVGDITVSDEVYGGAWDGSFEVPTKNAVYDKIQSLAIGISDGDKGDVVVSGSGAAMVVESATPAGGVFAINGRTTITEGLRSAGAYLDRFEGTGGSAIPGSVGLGIELYNSAGLSYIQSYNRTTAAFGPLTIVATGITLPAITGTTAGFSGAISASNLSGTNTGDQFTAMTSSRLLGRTTAGFGAAEQLTAAQAKTLLAIAAGDVSGLSAFATSTDLVNATGSLAAARIANDLITNAMLVDMAANALRGNNTGSAADPLDLTPVQVAAMLPLATADPGGVKGLMSAEDKTRLVNMCAPYTTVIEPSGSHTAARVAGTYGFGHGDPLAISGTGTLYPLDIIYLDPADFPAIGTLVNKFRLRCTLAVNDVAPTGNFTIGLHPVTRPGTSGAAGLNIYTIGAAVAGSGITLNTPAADSINNMVGADFAMPAAGHYAIGLVTTATVAASSHVHLSAVLQRHYA